VNNSNINWTELLVSNEKGVVSAKRSTFRCRASTEMLGNLVENNPNHSNKSLKMLSEGFYENDFLLNDFNMACNDLPQELLFT